MNGRSSKAFKAFFVSAAFSVAAVFSSSTMAQDGFDVFANADENSTQRVNYTEFDEFLKTFGREEKNRLTLYYSAMIPRGVEYLDAYTDALARLTPSKFTRDEQLAYWLNMRNILIVRAIGNGSIGRSLKEERGDLEKPGEMWTRKRLSIEGVAMSINDIEQKIILRNFNEPAVLYGLYQGAEGGPSLPAKTFSGASVYDTLEELGQAYVNARRTVSVKSGKVKAPAIYSWYKETLFDGDDATVIAHISALAEGKLKENLVGATIISAKKFSYSIDEYEVRQRPQANIGGSQSAGGGGFGRGS